MIRAFSLSFLVLLVVASVGFVNEESSRDDVPMLLSTAAELDALEEGRLALKEMRLDEAESKFQQLSLSDGGNIAAQYHLTTSSLIKFLMTDEDVYYEEFTTRSSALKRLLKEEPASLWRRYLDAEMNLQRSIVRGKRGKYFKAARAARSAYNGFEHVIKRDPAFYEAYKGMGLLQVTLGSAPSFYRKFLRLFGFSGDMEEGLGNLRIAADKSDYNREEALAFITLIDVILYGSTLEGAEAAETLHSEYSSPLFSHLYGYYLHENRRAAEAEEAFRFAVSSFDNSDYFPIHYAKFYLGSALFRQNIFDEAVEHIESYLEVHQGLALRASAQLHAGMAHEVLGRRDRAETHYRSIEVKREFDLDAASKRQADRLLESPMTAADIVLLKGHNLYDAGSYLASDSIMLAAAEEMSLPESQLSEVHYRLGRSRHAQGRLDEALRNYETSIHHDPADGSRWSPWSMYYRGTIFEQRQELEKAKTEYRHAREYRGKYDYRSAIHNNVKIAMRRLDAS